MRKIKWIPNLPIEKLIEELAEIERGLSEEQKLEDVVDMASLPSAPIPPDIDTSYPVWAMDTRGYCLVGSTADQIERVDSIREAQTPETQVFTIKMSTGLHERLRDAAHEQHRSMADIAREAIERHLK